MPGERSPAPEAAAAAPMQPLSSPAASLPLQGSSSLLPPNLPASPSAFGHRNRQVRAGQNWNLLLFLRSAELALGGYLSLLPSLALLGLSVTSCTAKPQNGLWPRVLTLVTITWSGSTHKSHRYTVPRNIPGERSLQKAIQAYPVYSQSGNKLYTQLY